MKNWIHIRSKKFPIAPGEKEEIVNEGTYGRNLSTYLQTKLTELGHKSPFICCEDWGWWVSIKDAPVDFGVCVYSLPTNEEATEYVCCPSTANSGTRLWSWRKFRFIEMHEMSEKLVNDMKKIFESDADIELLEVTDEYPL